MHITISLYTYSSKIELALGNLQGALQELVQNAEKCPISRNSEWLLEPIYTMIFNKEKVNSLRVNLENRLTL